MDPAALSYASTGVASPYLAKPPLVVPGSPNCRAIAIPVLRQAGGLVLAFSESSVPASRLRAGQLVNASSKEIVGPSTVLDVPAVEQLTGSSLQVLVVDLDASGRPGVHTTGITLLSRVRQPGGSHEELACYSHGSGFLLCPGAGRRRGTCFCGGGTKGQGHGKAQESHNSPHCRAAGQHHGVHQLQQLSERQQAEVRVDAAKAQPSAHRRASSSRLQRAPCRWPICLSLLLGWGFPRCSLPWT